MITCAVAVCSWTFLFSVAHEHGDLQTEMDRADQQMVKELAQDRFFSSNQTLAMLTWPKVLEGLNATSEQIMDIELMAIGISPGMLEGDTRYAKEFQTVNRGIWEYLDYQQKVRFVQISNQINRQTTKPFSEYDQGMNNSVQQWTGMKQSDFDRFSEQIEKSTQLYAKRMQEIYAGYCGEIEEFIASSKPRRWDRSLIPESRITIFLQNSRFDSGPDSPLFAHFESGKFIQKIGLKPSDEKELRALLVVIREEFRHSANELFIKHHEKIRNLIDNRAQSVLEEKYGAPFSVLSFEETLK